MSRTGTGSIRVTKIIQKHRVRPGKRKYTIANAESIEMTILPTATVTAITALFQSMRPMLAFCHAAV